MLLPTPDIGPLGPVGNYSIEFVSDVAMARCEFGRQRRGQRHLAGIEVQPPVVLVNYSEADIQDIRTVGWSFQLEKNSQQAMFSREWETVARSRRQTTAAIDGRPTSFSPLSLVYDGSGDDKTAVYRARVIVEWFTRNLELAGSVELVLTNYQEEDQLPGSWSSHCGGARPSAG